MKASQSGKLVLSAASGSNRQQANSIRIIPTHELPPPAPGSFEKSPAFDIPHEFALRQNFPNPFNPSTLIRYSLPADVHVTLTVYNVLGAAVASLVDEMQSAGYKEVKLDAANFSSGFYFYRLKAGNFLETKKMLLLK